MKEQNASEKKKARWSGEKKFYVFTAIGCAAVMLAIIIIAVAVSGKDKVNNQVDNGNNNVEISTPDENVGGEDSGNEEAVGGLPEGMISPLSAVTVLNDYGFYYNQTLNSYYEHMGMDFTAAAGTEVYVVEDGVVESIYKDDLLSGTEIVVKHGNGLRSLYRFVTETADLKVGVEVKKGDVIATVAEATGDEYKDGAHLHFEILQNGKSVDPAIHLTLEEK
ncbi:MAG: M23 family metallopeptidase [Clostridiales bacterium]|nr:M23 family metallopeptidase [Clostridiales bacterium]